VSLSRAAPLTVFLQGVRVQNWVVIVASVVAIVVVLLALSLVYSRMLPAASLAGSVGVSLAAAATGVVAWLTLAPVVLPQTVGALYWPIAALGGVAAFLATLAVRAVGAGVFVTLVFGLAWSALVFVPSAILTFGITGLTGSVGFEPVDHGGSIAVNVAGGAAALGVLFAAGRAAPRPRTSALPLGVGVAAVLALSAGWITWLAWAELAIDDVTPSIVLNGLVGALGGIGGWVIVQRIRHQHTTITGVAGGLVSGLVSITAGAPLLTTVSSAVAGITAGAIACIFTLRRVGGTRRPPWFIVGSHLIAGAVGIVILGVLATGTGYLFTGDPSIIYTGRFGYIEKQVVAVLLVAAYSTGISYAVWMLLKRATASRVVVETP